MKVLITGFTPFGGETLNPSYEAVKLIGEMPEHIELIKAEIPTVFGKAKRVLTELVETHNPEVVICVGQAGGRTAVTPERIAINVDDARIADNEGNIPKDETIAEDGDTAYFSTLPIKAIVEGIKAEGIPAAVSNTAGTFVCNHIAYHIGYYNQRHCGGKLSCGFIHIPYCPDQVLNKANTPSMSLKDIAKALEVAILVSVEEKKS